jgi:hypothetical protein
MKQYQGAIKMNKQATKPEITATAIYKILGHDCWMVPSDSADTMYKVCYNNELNIWECECRHGQEQAKNAQPARCKHVRAVQVSIVANKKATKPLEALPTLNGNRERKFEQAPSGCMVPMR